jgi:hypothetical protein
LSISVYLHASRTHTYTATLGSPCGDALATSVNEPVFSSCRALKARGMTGPVHFFRSGKSEPDYIVHDLEKAAGWTVRENEKQGPRIVRYRPPVMFLSDRDLTDLPASAPDQAATALS